MSALWCRKADLVTWTAREVESTCGSADSLASAQIVRLRRCLGSCILLEGLSFVVSLGERVGDLMRVPITGSVDQPGDPDIDTMPLLAWSLKMAKAANTGAAGRFMILHQVGTPGVVWERRLPRKLGTGG